MWVSDGLVSAVRVPGGYPARAPFHPDCLYPEYRLSQTGDANPVYEAVRESLRLLGLDSALFGTPDWNPLGSIVHPGDHVVVKPNLIWHSHKYRPEQWQQVITHGAVVRALTDYVLLALDGTGEVAIADGPQLDADWDSIVERTGLGEVVAFYGVASAVAVGLLDLRDSCTDTRGDVKYGERELPGDPLGGLVVDLGEDSRLADNQGAGRYYGADYDMEETNRHHSGGRHEYRLAATAASADVIINIPKMKTHKKVGVTLSMKNIVGVNSGRNWLPHYTSGDPRTCGDQFPGGTMRTRTERLVVRALQRLTLRLPGPFAPIFKLAKKAAIPVYGQTTNTIRSGNWYGNDTCWRMVHDINRALLFDVVDARPSKRYFALVDGIVAGEGGGPEAPDAREAGVLVAGSNPVAVDCVSATLMGFDVQKIPMLREAFADSRMPLASFTYGDIAVASNEPAWEGALARIDPGSCLDFRPHFGWEGHIELPRGEPDVDNEGR
jgi:uncharacterized protein (DUF362 family)